ncbi:MAG: Ig domain-containing protein [Gemmatimonadales bacterium]
MAAKFALRRGITAFYGPIVALLLAGCEGGTIIVVDSCSGVAVFVGPHRSVLRVGDTVRLDANFGSPECVPAGLTTEEWRWSSSNTSIARIDSLSGLAEGVAPGDAIIYVHHARNSEVVSSVGLTVVESH